MLTTKLAIFDVTDTEAFCSAALDQQLKRWQARLEPADREDALAYLISETWRISLRYNPDRSPSFTAYARSFQPRFLIQFYRDRFIDTRYKRRYTETQWAQIQQLVFAGPLDPTGPDGEPDQYPAATERPQDPLEFALRALAGDVAADCDPDLARILNHRDQPSHRLEARPDPAADEHAPLRAA